METQIETVDVTVQTPRAVFCLLVRTALQHTTPVALVAEWALRAAATFDQERRHGCRFVFMDRNDRPVGSLPDHLGASDPPPRAEAIAFPLTREAARVLDDLARTSGRSTGAVLRSAALLLRDLLEARECGWTVQVLNAEGRVDGFLRDVVGRRATLH